MNWAEFARLEPELAVWGAERFERTGLVFVGTLRKDGWPRISPVEPMFVGEQLYLGMMWRSVKALDLLRDPRCTIHNAVSDREGVDGEFKLYGRAFEITDLAERRRFCDAVESKIGWAPEEIEFHCFAIDIESASSSELRDGQFHRQVWKSVS